MTDDSAPFEVIPLVRGSWLKAPLVYRPPLVGRVLPEPGCLVRIPLRGRNETGVIFQRGTTQEVPSAKIKRIQEVVYEDAVIPPDLMQLALWMQEYYAEPVASVLESMIPAPIRRGMRPHLVRLIEALPPKADDPELEALRRRAPRQYELYRFLRGQRQPVSRSLVLERLNFSPSVCEGLVRRGLVSETEQRQFRDAYADDLGASASAVALESPPELTEEQAEVTKTLLAAQAEGEFCVRLLHGVTGSGKTEVYLRVMEAVLQAGGGVLFLVPEIALAPQTVARLRARLEAEGIRAVVWHSFLSDGERFDAWRALVSGEARVVVGARSAVFAPVRNLRCIIVDEEHEPSYKQEESPRYHGRDVAVYRSRLLDALCILGSATPSLESLYNARRGKYGLDLMRRRVDDRKLPTLHLVDMRLEYLKNREQGKGSLALSRMLLDKLRERLEQREQSILFLNRRGYATSLLCMECGWVAESPNSSVTMTYHHTDDRLRCHLSGYEEAAPQRCPKCGADALRKRGIGTQRVEQAVQAIFPRARVVRMDADVMTRKHLYRQIFDDFRVGKIDILIGTQMIAKGLDFPNVTLVGLVDADLSMHLPDFRAAERTFQLVVQVSGRSGRGDGHGEVVVQTFNPASAPLLYARQQDFDGFLDEELEQRREFAYPPFRHLIRHIFRGPNPEKVQFFAEEFARRAEVALGALAEIRGPAPAPLAKIKDAYRFHIWYFVESVTRTVPLLEEVRRDFPRDRDVLHVLDVDPMQVL